MRRGTQLVPALLAEPAARRVQRQGAIAATSRAVGELDERGTGEALAGFRGHDSFYGADGGFVWLLKIERVSELGRALLGLGK